MNARAPQTEAATALTTKAARLRAIADTDPRAAATKQRQITALERLAAVVTQGHDAIVTHVVEATEFTPEDRVLAATEIHALAMRHESEGSTGRVGGPTPPGFQRGGTDFATPIHEAALRHASALYDIALALHYEEYWAYTQGLLVEKLGDYAAAIRAFEALRGTYADPGRQQAERCRRKLEGSYNATVEARASFDDTIAKFTSRGVDASAVRYAKEVYLSALSSVPKEPARPKLASVSSISAFEQKRKARSDSLERAASAAQLFAERLVYGDFAGAQAMLAAELSSLHADDLRDAYKRMTSYGDPGPAGVPTISVGSVERDMPGMTARDLGYVYVSIMGEDFVEAVTVVVTDEGGEAKIRELEWGRP